ncbi:hypothetical protein GGX14DRAFT_387344 [Mycena pura]|uniref:Aip3p/Bud6 N-terminal domain-containing protein n=1 Tax=Mycena pura TaxID=153505 RepID=A0AAD6YNW8_9AGAR|nr:hypothetical protein GGX14DRAFT_387344 [Mycena pura]
MYGTPPPPGVSRSSTRSSTSTYSTPLACRVSDATQQGPRTPAPAPDDVQAAVRNLLLSTRDMPGILAQWARGAVSEADVSDVYVQIGTDFNAAVQAFAYHRIDLSDIHSVPAELRAVLEQCLAEDPSPALLATYMPGVRAALVKLLRGLQARQEAWRRARAAGVTYDHR